MRTHASRSAALLTALGIAFVAPRPAGAATPTCEFGGNPELGSYTMTCSYLNMPRYSQLDPNLAYIRAPQVVLDFEANGGYAGIYADWPNNAGSGGTSLPNYGTSADANDNVTNNDVAGGTIQVHSWGAFSQSWLRSGPGSLSWLSTSDPGNIGGVIAASNNCNAFAETMALQAALLNRATDYYTSQPYTQLSGWLASFYSGSPVGWDGWEAQCTPTSPATAMPCASKNPDTGNWNFCGPPTVENALYGTNPQTGPNPPAAEYYSLCKSNDPGAAVMDEPGLNRCVDLNVLTTVVPLEGTSCLGPDCEFFWPHYDSFAPFVKADTAEYTFTDKNGNHVTATPPAVDGLFATTIPATSCSTDADCAVGYCLASTGVCGPARYTSITSNQSVLCFDGDYACNSPKTLGATLKATLPAMEISNASMRAVIDAGGTGIFHKSWFTVDCGQPAGVACGGSAIKFTFVDQSHYLALQGYTADYVGLDVVSTQLIFMNPSYGVQTTDAFVDVPNGVDGVTLPYSASRTPFSNMLAFQCTNCPVDTTQCVPSPSCTDGDGNEECALPGGACQPHTRPFSVSTLRQGDTVNFIDEAYWIYVY